MTFQTYEVHFLSEVITWRKVLEKHLQTYLCIKVYDLQIQFTEMLVHETLQGLK